MADLGDRTQYIGGSDIPVILGQSKFKKPQQLLLEKLGLRKPFAGSLQTEFGHQIEDDLISYFELEMGISVFGKQEEFKSDILGFPVICHVDGLTSDDSLLEVKSTGINYKSDWDNGLPSYYKGQVQFYLWKTGKKKAYVIVGFRDVDEDGNYKVYEVKIVEEYFDESYINWATPIIEDFVRKIQNKEIGEQLDSIAEIEVDLLKELKKDYKKIEEQIKEIEDKIKSSVKIDVSHTLGKYIIEYKNVSSKKIDTDKLKKDKLYDEYCKESISKRLTIKNIDSEE